MPRLAHAAGSDASVVELEGLVRPALVAAGLLVAQQVAAKATRDALFLSSFPVTALPLIAAASAGLSLAGVLAFSRGMGRSAPLALVRRLLAASAVLLAAEWALSLAAPRPAAVLVYVHVGLFGATVVSGFWSVVNERFDPWSARRVIGRIGTGAALGGVAGGLLTWRAAALLGLPTLLLLLAFLTLASLPVLGRLAARPAPALVVEPPAAPPSREAWRFLADPYLRDLSLLVALCALTEALLDYVLCASVTARLLPGAPLARFFALYHMIVGVLALAVQAALTRRSLERIGLARTLAVPPSVVAVGALAALLLPGAWPRVALRGLQAVLANSLFRSAYELLYTPLAPDRKRPVKALLDVGADRGGTIAGSAVVLLALRLPAAGTIPALLLLAALAAAVTLVLTRRLHAGYVAALAESLRTGAARLEGSEARAPAAALAGRPLAAPPRAEAEVWARSAADLRSREPSRVRAALARERPLPADLVPLVLPLLRRDDLFTDAVAALREVGARCTGQLLDALLDPEEDPVVRRRVPRVLKAVPTQRAVDGLLLALEDGRFDVRYRSAQALVRLCLRGGPLSVPAEPLLAVARRELAIATPSARGLDHVAGLLALAFPGEPLHVAVRASRGGDASLRGTALEYLENVLPAALWSALWPWLGSRAEAAVSSGRTLEEVREDLLRSTRSWTLARRTGTRPLSREQG